jgi:predicted RNase H-like HicB family nuclease
MTYTVVYQKIVEKDFPAGFYYAHIPALDLTTQGIGIEGAKEAARDLLKLWIEEKKAAGEKPVVENEVFISNLEIEDALFS